MPRKALPPPCNDKDRQTLKDWAVSRSMEARLVERARMICKLLDGDSVSKVASDLKVRPNTIIDWRNRFSAQGIAGLYDRPRSGKPPKYDEEFRVHVLKTLEQPPPPGPVTLGRSGGCQVPWRIGRCGLARTSQTEHLPSPTTKLVRQHRSRVCPKSC